MLATLLNMTNFKVSVEVMDQITKLIDDNRPPTETIDEPANRMQPEITQNIQVLSAASGTSWGDGDDPGEDIPVATEVAIGYGPSSSAQVEIFHDPRYPEHWIQPQQKKKSKKKKARRQVEE